MYSIMSIYKEVQKEVKQRSNVNGVSLFLFKLEKEKRQGLSFDYSKESETAKYLKGEAIE